MSPAAKKFESYLLEESFAFVERCPVSTDLFKKYLELSFMAQGAGLLRAQLGKPDWNDYFRICDRFISKAKAMERDSALS